MAQLGFAASLIGEGLTGKGILGQIGLEVILPCELNHSCRLCGFRCSTCILHSCTLFVAFHNKACMDMSS